MTQRSLPRGGFTLGLIVGLLIGLAVALAVAMYVTRAPVPFVDKVPGRGAAGDQAEAERNRAWDPNAPLAGRTPAPKPVAVASQPLPVEPAAAVAAATPPKASAPARAPGAASAASAPRDKASAPKPRASAPTAASGATPPATTATTTTALASAPAKPPVWHVQAGAFSTQDEAEAQRARLAMLGLTARLQTRDAGGGRTQYRVRLGPFNDREPADDVRDRLNAAGIESTLVKVEPR